MNGAETDGKFYERILNPDVYHCPNINWEVIEEDLSENVTLSNSRKVIYYQFPISFDIETTSFEYNGEKRATMYAWGMSINGHVILGRTWTEFMEVYDKLVELFQPIGKTRLLIYIQNLSYEFQFICKLFEWEKVFAIKERKPLFCLTEDNIEFRCSYLLSGFSLEKMGENLQRYKILKKVGDLDYNLIRHSNTPLTDKEWGYLINDVQVVCAYIKETAENDGGYNKIPLTKTGYVRNYCREHCFTGKYYRKLMKVLTLSADEYKQLKRAFQGGFVHANWRYSGKLLYDIDSFDFTSSYPAVMVAEKFPMSKAEYIPNPTEDEFEKYLKTKCCLFDIEFVDIDGWDAPDHILSRSKCMSIDPKATINNGRVIEAKYAVTTMTEVDYESFKKFYKWKSKRIANLRIYDKAYLPHKFVEAILQLYVGKTELKGVDGKEVEYMKKKGMVNSAFGMCVTDIVRDEDSFVDEWYKVIPSPESEIDKYNNSSNRFLFYPWGVWVTAYARRNLFTGIMEFGDDYVYSDTDSVKGRNAEKHRHYIEKYNEITMHKMKLACEHHKIPIESIKPKTIKGEEKPLGVWDYDGHYTKFKTLGAKRYLVETKQVHYITVKGRKLAITRKKIQITVAGLSKTRAVPYMKKLAISKRKSIFDVFNDDLYVDGENTGKMTHTYNDNEFYNQLEDYLGNVTTVHEYSCIHLAPADYSLSLDMDYIKLLNGVHYEEE